MKYRIRGNGQRYWIQERVLFWWSDVLQVNHRTDKMYRKEYTTREEAQAAILLLVALDILQKKGIMG